MLLKRLFFKKEIKKQLRVYHYYLPRWLNPLWALILPIHLSHWVLAVYHFQILTRKKNSSRIVFQHESFRYMLSLSYRLNHYLKGQIYTYFFNKKG